MGCNRPSPSALVQHSDIQTEPRGACAKGGLECEVELMRGFGGMEAGTVDDAVNHGNAATGGETAEAGRTTSRVSQQHLLTASTQC